MAYTVTPLGFAGALKLLRDAAMTATADVNLNDGSATLYAMFIDNSAVAAITYVKGYNAFSPTVGTTDPDLVLMIPANARKTAIFTSGNAWSTALSLCATTTGGTGGVANPAGSVVVDAVVA